MLFANFSRFWKSQTRITRQMTYGILVAFLLDAIIVLVFYQHHRPLSWQRAGFLSASLLKTGAWLGCAIAVSRMFGMPKGQPWSRDLEHIFRIRLTPFCFGVALCAVLVHNLSPLFGLPSVF